MPAKLPITLASATSLDKSTFDSSQAITLLALSPGFIFKPEAWAVFEKPEEKVLT